MKTGLITLMILICQTGMAFDKEDSRIALQAAMQSSNKDYNTHRKEVLDQENDRIGSWGERNIQAVKVSNDIQVEAADFYIEDEIQPIEDNENKSEVAQEVPVIHEVSMNN